MSAKKGPTPAFSFCLGDLASERILADAQTSRADKGTTRYQHGESGLTTEVSHRMWEEYAAAEWMLTFRNDGVENSETLSNVYPLNLVEEIPADAAVTLHYANGSMCVAEDFLPKEQRLNNGGEIVLAPNGGRSSDGVLPFVNIQWPGGGCVIAIGWSGQWRACFKRDSEGNLNVTAGMETCSLYLEPGESIRTPSVLVMKWEGDDAEIGNNKLRGFLLEHIVPKGEDGTPALPPISHNRQLVYYRTDQATEKDHLEALEKAHEIGIELFWIDALWYGENTGGGWWERVGDWTVDRSRFPNGLGPIGKAAHERGMKFMLWFEPERVRPGTPVAREHGEFVLKVEGDEENLLLNLGDPAARTWLTDMISGVIKEGHVDIYRQDFNFSPTAYWEAADPEGRTGITEIRHVEGLYTMWDELCERHPGLLIDNCASGGRRIDYETTKRSFPLWRSDYTDAGALNEGMMANVGAQVQTAGLSRWVPLHAASIYNPTPYDLRSTFATGFCFYEDILDESFDVEAAKEAVAEVKRLRPFMVGDLHVLAPLTIEKHDWCAYQYHRPDMDAGFAVFLRRNNSPFLSFQAEMKGIETGAVYEVTLAHDFRVPVAVEMFGSELRKLTVDIPKKPAALLVEYRKK